MQLHIREGRAQAIKMEGGRTIAPQVKALTEAESSWPPRPYSTTYS